MAYIDVILNTDLKLDDNVAMTVYPTVADITFTAAIMTFSVVEEDENGMYKIAADGIGSIALAAGDQIIIRNSVQVAVPDTDPYVNNDGVYIVKYNHDDATPALDYIYVEEPVVAAVSDEVANLEEYDTFIITSSRRAEQICAFIEVGATPASIEVSFAPGAFWAARIEKGLPVMQGDPLVAEDKYFVQVETARYLQTEEEELIPIDEGPPIVPAKDKKGTMLMRVFPIAGTALGALVEVGFVQLG